MFVQNVAPTDDIGQGTAEESVRIIEQSVDVEIMIDLTYSFEVQQSENGEGGTSSYVGYGALDTTT